VLPTVLRAPNLKLEFDEDERKAINR
jgi:hypothetical protein